MKLIAQGAEAIIYKDNDKIIKERVRKGYRLKILDKKLRRARTKAESKIIKKLKDIIPVPEILDTDNEEKIEMQFLEGEKLSKHLEKLDWKTILKQLAINLTKLHDQDLIHGDLTTSNMILKDNKVYLIDFGLGFHSRKIEDKAVDLHLLKQALDAKHFSIFPEAFDIILNNYEAKEHDLIIKRIDTIEKRSRYRH
jgi:Kae1-associated kinase Bud32